MIGGVGGRGSVCLSVCRSPMAVLTNEPPPHTHTRQRRHRRRPRQAEAALEAEKARVAHYLNPTETEEKLLKVVMEELLEKQEMTLLER